MSALMFAAGGGYVSIVKILAQFEANMADAKN